MPGRKKIHFQPKEFANWLNIAGITGFNFREPFLEVEEERSPSDTVPSSSFSFHENESKDLLECIEWQEIFDACSKVEESTRLGIPIFSNNPDEHIKEIKESSGDKIEIFFNRENGSNEIYISGSKKNRIISSKGRRRLELGLNVGPSQGIYVINTYNGDRLFISLTKKNNYRIWFEYKETPGFYVYKGSKTNDSSPIDVISFLWDEKDRGKIFLLYILRQITKKQKTNLEKLGVLLTIGKKDFGKNIGDLAIREFGSHKLFVPRRLTKEDIGFMMSDYGDFKVEIQKIKHISSWKNDTEFLLISDFPEGNIVISFDRANVRKERNVHITWFSPSGTKKIEFEKEDFLDILELREIINIESIHKKELEKLLREKRLNREYIESDKRREIELIEIIDREYIEKGERIDQEWLMKKLIERRYIEERRKKYLIETREIEEWIEREERREKRGIREREESVGDFYSDKLTIDKNLFRLNSLERLEESCFLVGEEQIPVYSNFKEEFINNIERSGRTKNGTRIFFNDSQDSELYYINQIRPSHGLNLGISTKVYIINTKKGDRIFISVTNKNKYRVWIEYKETPGFYVYICTEQINVSFSDAFEVLLDEKENDRNKKRFLYSLGKSTDEQKVGLKQFAISLSEEIDVSELSQYTFMDDDSYVSRKSVDRGEDLVTVNWIDGSSLALSIKDFSNSLLLRKIISETTQSFVGTITPGDIERLFLTEDDIITIGFNQSYEKVAEVFESNGLDIVPKKLILLKKGQLDATAWNNGNKIVFNLKILEEKDILEEEIGETFTDSIIINELYQVFRKSQDPSCNKEKLEVESLIFTFALLGHSTLESWNAVMDFRVEFLEEDLQHSYDFETSGWIKQRIKQIKDSKKLFEEIYTFQQEYIQELSQLLTGLEVDQLSNSAKGKFNEFVHKAGLLISA